MSRVEGRTADQRPGRVGVGSSDAAAINNTAGSGHSRRIGPAEQNGTEHDEKRYEAVGFKNVGEMNGGGWE